MSAIDQITTLMETMSFAEKLSLNERIATAIRKEGKGSKTSKKSSDDEVKPKRKAAAGTLAWTAFVKHIKTTQPDAFDGIKKESDKLQIVKGIRAEDMSAYETFVSEWKENYEASQAEAADEAEVAEEVVVAPKTVTPAMTPAQKIAAIKAAKAASAPAAKEEKAAPAKKEVKKAAVKKAPVKKAKETKEDDVKQLPVLTLEDVSYWHDEDTQGLWRKDAETFSGDNWVGYYQPGNDEEPIRYTENFGDE